MYFLLGFVPVSYTHLDVYKRQASKLFKVTLGNLTLYETASGGNIQGDKIFEIELSLKDVMIQPADLLASEVKILAYQVEKFFLNVVLTYEPTAAEIEKWQKAQYLKINEKYNTDLENYKKDVYKIFEENPIIDKFQDEDKGYIQHICLRKQCISYLISDEPQNSNRKMGQDMFVEKSRDSINTLKVNINHVLNEYTAFARFLEQAFDWNMMNYSYYPFYWAKDTEWKRMYNLHDSDSEFKKFLKAVSYTHLDVYKRQ